MHGLEGKLPRSQGKDTRSPKAPLQETALPVEGCHGLPLPLSCSPIPLDEGDPKSMAPPGPGPRLEVISETTSRPALCGTQGDVHDVMGDVFASSQLARMDAHADQACKPDVPCADNCTSLDAAAQECPTSQAVLSRHKGLILDRLQDLADQSHLGHALKEAIASTTPLASGDAGAEGHAPDAGSADTPAPVVPHVAAPGQFYRMTDRHGHPLGIRSAPDASSETRTGKTVFPGEVVEVAEVRTAPDGKQAFLRLADGRGWVFARNPHDGRRLFELVESAIPEAIPITGEPTAVATSIADVGGLLVERALDGGTTVEASDVGSAHSMICTGQSVDIGRWIATQGLSAIGQAASHHQPVASDVVDTSIVTTPLVPEGCGVMLPHPLACCPVGTGTKSQMPSEAQLSETSYCVGFEVVIRS